LEKQQAAATLGKPVEGITQEDLTKVAAYNFEKNVLGANVDNVVRLINDGKFREEIRQEAVKEIQESFEIDKLVALNAE
jgi:hypothetical protein